MRSAQRVGWILGVTGALAAGGAPLAAGEIRPVKAVVLRSTGTVYLNQTFWPELNAGWSQFGEVPVQIDYRSLSGYGWTYERIAATGADVLILSNPAYWPYSADEIEAVRRYVEEGHGLIITYGKFRSEDRALAPLVGLPESVQVGSNTLSYPIVFEPVMADHPLFAGVPSPYVTGVPYMSSAQPLGWDWPVTGTVLAKATVKEPDSVPPPRFVYKGVIVANDAGTYRGLYFSHYIECLSDGANQQDMQVFYNGLVWAAKVPEPATLGIVGLAMLIGGRGRRKEARMEG